MLIIIRAFLPKDHESIIELTKRLSEIDMPEWRKAEQIENTNIAMVKNAMEESDPDNVILVAQAAIENQVVGYIRLQTQTDYFSGEKYGYVANIAVNRAFEGQGVGHKLLERAENWTRDKGYTHLKLHVFVENTRALQVYEKYGYNQDIIEYVKVLSKS